MKYISYSYHIILRLLFFLVYMNFLDPYLQATRSIFRPSHQKLPQIVTYWKDQPDMQYKLRDSHLELYPLFRSFNYNHFMSHQIPQGPLLYRNNTKKSVDGAVLCAQMEKALQELKEGKKKLTHFKILKRKDFNDYMLSGNIILKFKEYPFVAKLFMENPHSFTLPFSKGWQPGGLYIMSGGINRFLAGFTRIKNLEQVQAHISKDPYWSTRLSTPRKWFYLPCNTRWFTLEGLNIGPRKYACTQFPSAYFTVSDAIITKGKTPTLFNKADRKRALKICHFLGNRIDPHIDNFVEEDIEKSRQLSEQLSDNKTAPLPLYNPRLPKKTFLSEQAQFQINQHTNASALQPSEDTIKNMVILDTEHFASMVGLKEDIRYKTYLGWYSQLTRKFITDKYARLKSYRKQLQKNPRSVIFWWQW